MGGPEGQEINEGNPDCAGYGLKDYAAELTSSYRNLYFNRDRQDMQDKKRQFHHEEHEGNEENTCSQ